MVWLLFFSFVWLSVCVCTSEKQQGCTARYRHRSIVRGNNLEWMWCWIGFLKEDTGIQCALTICLCEWKSTFHGYAWIHQNPSPEICFKQEHGLIRYCTVSAVSASTIHTSLTLQKGEDNEDNVCVQKKHSQELLHNSVIFYTNNWPQLDSLAITAYTQFCKFRDF